MTARRLDVRIMGLQPMVLGGAEVPHEAPTFERPEWHALAACGRNGVLGDNPRTRIAIMFPGRGVDSAQAKSVCEGCPVADECATHDERFGVWAGRSEHQRQEARSVAFKQRRCAVCNDPFHPTAPGNTLCSPVCVATARRRRERKATAKYQAKAVGR